MNWGFIGAGRMANRMIQAFSLLDDAHVISVWDGVKKCAEDFSAKWNIPKVCGTLDEMLDDEALDVVYVVTPHLVHRDHVMSALAKGKHVLCEKPMAMSKAQTEEMAAFAREKKRFLMEAYWTRFFPATQKMVDIIQSGELGEVRHVDTEFGIYIPYDENTRFFNKELGGGSMRGAGIYPIGFALTAFGEYPTDMIAIADMKNGVDVRGAAVMRFANGGTATVETGYDGFNSRCGRVTCTKGWITVPLLISPSQLHISTEDGGTRVLELPYQEPGLQYELREVMDCISAGKTESEKMPLDVSIGMAGVFDRFYEEIEKEN